jgi:hypothetical protein
MNKNFNFLIRGDPLREVLTEMIENPRPHDMIDWSGKDDPLKPLFGTRIIIFKKFFVFVLRFFIIFAPLPSEFLDLLVWSDYSNRVSEIMKNPKIPKPLFHALKKYQSKYQRSEFKFFFRILALTSF